MFLSSESIAHAEGDLIFHVEAHWVSALPDGGFLRQIWKILADLKVIWQAKNISGWLLISGRFLADFTNFAWVCFCLADRADSGGFGVSISKKQLFSHFFLHFLGFIICQLIKRFFFQIILGKKIISFSPPLR
jgi:hypothetical protein